MAAGAGRHRNQAVGALPRWPLRAKRSLMMSCITVPPPAVHRLVQLFTGAQGGDHHRHFVLLAQLQVFLQTVVGLCTIWFDRERRGRLVRVIPVPGGQFLGDARASHSSSCDSGRAFNDGNDPTTPRPCTGRWSGPGCEIQNSGEQITWAAAGVWRFPGAETWRFLLQWVRFTL